MYSNKFFQRLILLVAGLLILSPAMPQSGKSEIGLTMTDGVSLSTAVFVPKGKGPFPTVLVRTPYDRKADEWMGKVFNLFRIAVVLQDVRGKFQSEGVFYPFVNERSDGLVTLQWIRDQPWSNGIVGGYGASYLGITQWAVADSLDCMNLLVSGANLYEFLYPDGLFSLQSALTWGSGAADQKSNRVDPERLAAGFRTLPVSVADDSTIKDIDFLNDWMLHEQYDAFWERMNFRGNTDARLLSVAGWYDIFLKSQIADFQALEVNGSSDHRMIIGPYFHGSPGEKIDYGGEKKTGKPAVLFKYIRKELKGKKAKLGSPLHDTRYNLFIMERNEYIGSDVWPPVATSMIPFYVGTGGYLDERPFADPGTLSYRYDPGDPYPSIGGTVLGDGVGPALQNENLTRSDQLVFEKRVDGKPLVLLGPIRAELWLSSTAACSDFIVCLQDRFPDGRIINIQEGGARVSFDGQEAVKAGISVWATGYQLNPGHTLRVVITSSWFPRFNRNLNTCEPMYRATRIEKAGQTVLFGTNTPSAIYLPVYQADR
jgi:uncharacterized protein